MILALPDEFFDGWEWTEGDKFLCREPYYGEESIIHPIGYEWNVHTIGDHELRDNEIYKGDYELAYRKRKEKIRPLPRQEQLQKMSGISAFTFIHMLHSFSEDQLQYGNKIPYDINCITLAFLMELKYGKHWDGDHWI